MVRPRVFIEFNVRDEPIGRVIFELFEDVAPKTVQNFRALATGERGVSALSQVPLSYKGSIIHRSIPGFMIQGGDFTKKNGTGGESIYGGTFPDENLDLPLDSEGLLVMANRGPDTNGSQFFVTLRPCPHLDGKHVVFGRVVKGFEIVTKISEIPTDEKARPEQPVVVSNCGELVLRKKNVTSTAPLSVPPRGRSLSPSRSSRRRSPRSQKGKRRRSFSSRSGSRSRSPYIRSRSLTPPQKPQKHKKSGKASKETERTNGGVPGKSPIAETEEELDARLEREEHERIAEKKLLEAVRLKDRLIASSKRNDASGGVRFKGRGLMKYRDPEIDRRHSKKY